MSRSLSNSVDLFSTSLLSKPLLRNARCLPWQRAFSVYRKSPGGVSIRREIFLWGETFKNGNPAFLYGQVVFLFGLKGPAYTLDFPKFSDDKVAEGFPVTEFVSDEIRFCEKGFQVVAGKKTQNPGNIRIGNFQKIFG